MHQCHWNYHEGRLIICPLSFYIFLKYEPFWSVSGMLDAHSADALVEMKSFFFLFIRPEQSIFWFGLSVFLLSSTFSDGSHTDCSDNTVSSSWGGQTPSDVAYKFQSCFQIYFLSCFLADIPLMPVSRFGHQIYNQHVGQFPYKLATFAVMTHLLDLQRSKWNASKVCVVFLHPRLLQQSSLGAKLP